MQLLYRSNIIVKKKRVKLKSYYLIILLYKRHAYFTTIMIPYVKITEVNYYYLKKKGKYNLSRENYTSLVLLKI